MRRAHKSRMDRESGVALFMALLLLTIISMLALSMTFATQMELWTTSNYQLLTQARYAAEAGAQQAATFLMNPSNCATSLGVTCYQPPSSYANYDLNRYPVYVSSGGTDSGVVVLSADSTTSNVPSADSSVQTNFSTALKNKILPGSAQRHQPQQWHRHQHHLPGPCQAARNGDANNCWSSAMPTLGNHFDGKGQC